MLQSQFQETDVTARVGGDEFLALMRDVAPKEAEACAAALGRAARKKLIGDDAIVEVPLRIGMAVYGEDGRDYELSLIHICAGGGRDTDAGTGA